MASGDQNATARDNLRQTGQKEASVPGSDYLDKCVGKVVSAALVHPPDMPAEAFDYALEAGWLEPEIAHPPYLLVDYD